MALFEISVRADTKALERDLTRLAEKQIPFATAQALNAVGKIVRDAERTNLKEKFPTATPFTLNSIALLKARKANPTVTILVKDIAASYLTPYEDGGLHKLNSRALLNPKNVGLNQYGNLPRNKLASLKANSDVFVGSITFKKSGQTVSGVWLRGDRGQRSGRNNRDSGKHGSLGNSQGRIAGARTTLKLLIRFGDAIPVKERLNYQGLARTVVAFNYTHEFNRAMTAALASAK